MSNKLSVVAICLSVLALGSSVYAIRQGDSISPVSKQTAFERVMKSRTLRCAYAAWPPYFVIDPNTKTLSGANYEIMQEVGRVANLKIDWVGEAGYGTFPDDLRMGKADMFCSGVRHATSRAQRVDMSDAAFVIPLYPFVRENDTRFDGNVESINKPEITIATIEGSAVDGVIKSSFPNAKRDTLPELAEAVLMLSDVAAGKADIAIADEVYVGAYNVKNPGKTLRAVSGIAPLKISGATFAVGKGEWELRDLINAAVAELQGDGTIDRILEKHKLVEQGVLPVAKSYQTLNK